MIKSLRMQTKQRIEQARRRLIYELEANGIDIELRMPIYKSDGMNGKIKEKEEKINVRGILATYNGGSGNMNMTDSGRKQTGTHKLTILYSEKVRPEYLTEFYTKDNQQYRVVDIQNVNNFNIAFSIECIHTYKRMEGYENGN